MTIKEHLIAAHKSSIYNIEAVKNSTVCGCFYCLETFAPSEIKDWVDSEKTALCPHCGIDSVIGDASGYPVTKEFLEEMKKYWF